MKMFRLNIVITILIMFVTGCSESDVAVAPSSVSFEAAKEAGVSYLAEEHSITVDLKENNVAPTFEIVIKKCKEDRENHCTVLDSRLNVGKHVSASLRIRVIPQGIDQLVSAATMEGNLTSRSTHVEDLVKPVTDNEERTRMLQAYIEDLIELQKQSKNNVEALIKVTSELAETQLKLDTVLGEHAFLRQRIDLDILNIRFVSERERSFWSPMGSAAEDFTDDLANGIADAITGFAYIIPWLFILIPLAFLVRILWRKFQ